MPTFSDTTNANFEIDPGDANLFRHHPRRLSEIIRRTTLMKFEIPVAAYLTSSVPFGTYAAKLAKQHCSASEDQSVSLAAGTGVHQNPECKDFA
jgi:hypothetical protein